MAELSLSELRTQLLALGYTIIPNRGKVPALKDWNGDAFIREQMPARVISWERRFPDAPSTGLLVTGRAVVLDLDIDDATMVDVMLARLETIAPQVAAIAPTRYGGGDKVALFCQLAKGEDPFTRIASRRYGGHCLEVFGGKPLRSGKVGRQFGIYGPHSFNDDGSVAREYVWAEGVPDLASIGAGLLPAITVAQVRALVDEFERIAQLSGWVVEAAVNTEDGTAAYDIDDATRFDTNRGGTGLSYAELTDELEAYGELRCSSNFMPGRGEAGKRERCWVFHSPRHDCTAVHVYGDAVTHYPKQYAPVDAGAPVDLGVAVPPRLLVDWRERYAHGGPKASLHNTRLAIEALGLVCSHDTFHNRMYIGRGEGTVYELQLFHGPVTDAALGALRMALSDTFGLDFGDKNVRDAVNILCSENGFDPVVDMLAEAEANWDGVARLDRMAVDYFNTADTELCGQCVRKTMIAAVARARNPGCKFDTILVMESPEGWNKSSAWALLAGEGNFSDQSIIGSSGRDVQEQLAGIWIHENAELAGMKKAEVEMVKAFASRQVDRARPAYAHFLVDQPRHSIEVATTNDSEYLLSLTGNRRFWPIEILARIDLGKLRAARLQLWGEAAHYQGQGEELTLPEHLWPVAAVAQEGRRVEHPWEPMLSGMSRGVAEAPDGEGYWGNGIVHIVGNEERVSSAVIFNLVLKIPAGQMHNGHSKQLAALMRRLGWERGTFSVDGKTVKGYIRTKFG